MPYRAATDYLSAAEAASRQHAGAGDSAPEGEAVAIALKLAGACAGGGSFGIGAGSVSSVWPRRMRVGS